MARKEQDRRLQGEMQRLSNNTGLSIGIDTEWLERKIVANDSSDVTHRMDETQLYLINAHGETEVFLKGEKPELSRTLEMINRIIEASKEVKGEFIKGPSNPG